MWRSQYPSLWGREKSFDYQRNRVAPRFIIVPVYIQLFLYIQRRLFFNELNTYMKNLRIQKLLTVSYPLTAVILGFVLGYATVFFGPYKDGIVVLTQNGLPVEMILIVIEKVGLLLSGIILVMMLIQDEVTNRSVLFSLFGIAYLGSAAYFTLAILEVITQLTLL